MANKALFFSRRILSMRERKKLLSLLDGMEAYLIVGYDLGFSWERVMGSQKEMGESIKGDLNAKDFFNWLRNFSHQGGFESLSGWAECLEEVYLSGAPLLNFFRSLSNQLRRQQRQDWTYLEKMLPQWVNILLLLFFFPPTFMMVFVPLIWAAVRLW